MKFKLVLISLFLTMFFNELPAQDVQLPAPQRTGGMPLSEAFALRRTTREFDASRELSMQLVSDLLWSAAGVNRPDGYRTNPTALGKQEIDLYIFDKSGVYHYDFTANALRKVKDGDHRSLIAGDEAFSQDFVLDAPASVVMVADIGKFGEMSDKAMMMGACDAGIVSQNINLFCAANGLATVTRATMDSDAISKLLGLSPSQHPILNNPVGYAR